MDKIAQVRRGANRSNSVTCISKAVSILNALNANINNIHDISKKVNLSNSSVHRLLQALVETGLAIEDPISHQYYLGFNLIKLTSNTNNAYQYVIRSAQDKLERLRDLSKETISLDVRMGMERVKLIVLMSQQSVAVIARPHDTSLIWTGAMGKVLLSQLAPQQLDDVLNRIELVPLTKFTITDKEAFRKEIENVRTQGYALSYSEAKVGISALSVPVRYFVEPLALSMTGPEIRFSQRMIDYLDDLKKTAQEIEKDLLRVTKLTNSSH
jgi:DNA-binding IclR family transcriptional regulator